MFAQACWAAQFWEAALVFPFLHFLWFISPVLELLFSSAGLLSGSSFYLCFYEILFIAIDCHRSSVSRVCAGSMLFAQDLRFSFVVAQAFLRCSVFLFFCF